MERNRKTRIIAVASMLIAIITLTIGFAVFSKNLNIQNISATVKANEANFSVKFSRSYKKVDESDVIPGGSMGKYGLDAHIDNSGANPKLTNISMELTDLNEAGVYDQDYYLYIINDGGIDAFLKSIKIANVPGYDKSLVCIASEGTSQKLVDEACKSFEVMVTINDKGIYIKSEGIKHGDGLDTNQSGNYTGITGMKLLKNFGNSHNFNIYYYWTKDLALIDGSFEIKIGDVTVEYSSQDN